MYSRKRRAIRMAVCALVFLSVYFSSDKFERISKTKTSEEQFELNKVIRCHDRSFEPSTEQRTGHWVLYSLVKADHGRIKCFNNVTYTTHGHFDYLHNLAPLVERWLNPISVAVFAPGDDFQVTLDSIRYMRECSSAYQLIRKYVTFHALFPYDHMPQGVQTSIESLNDKFDCSQLAPYFVESTYSYRNNLTYPINVARNIARDAALTHYVLASDIELYPSPNLPERFIEMIRRNEPPLNGTNPRVFPLHIFEVEENKSIPDTKEELVRMLDDGSAIPFHQRICSECHSVPMANEWREDRHKSELLKVFTVGKRTGEYKSWEPVFIGTRDDPKYEERLTWEGRSDKMTQVFVMCLMDYDFMVLNDAFLVHKPGIKDNQTESPYIAGTRDLLRFKISAELRDLYGDAKNCSVKNDIE